jgi:hypothetical protein
MKKLLTSLALIIISTFLFTSTAHAQAIPGPEETGLGGITIGTLGKMLVPQESGESGVFKDWFMNDACAPAQNAGKFNAGGCKTSPDGITYSNGLLGTQKDMIAMLYKFQPSGEEYIADVLDNIGIPSVNRAYAQGTGYEALNSFLPFWKVFRNLAYSLYIIMFVVVGIMIMLRTKVNAQNY